MKSNALIIGSGNIGTDLLIKMQTRSTVLAPLAMVGIDEQSDGLARARALGVTSYHQGLDGFMNTGTPSTGLSKNIHIAFDATSAGAHRHHAEVLQAAGIPCVDLTPAAIGPYVVPVANLQEHKMAPNVNMVTCGGQATIPVVRAVSDIGRVVYAEIVASISSRSAGPGTRANIDEFTETTSRGLEVVGDAERGKAIIVLNPADPPLVMRDTVYCLTESTDEAAIKQSVVDMVARVAEYVPGYRLAQAPVTEQVELFPPGEKPFSGTKVSVFLEVEGAGDYLPKYAGNLDIMTSAALKMGEEMVRVRAGGAS